MVSPTGKSFRFVRACVRACVRSKGRSIFADWSDAGSRVLLLSAFLEHPRDAAAVFGEDLFEAPRLLPTFRRLIGLAGRVLPVSVTCTYR